MRLPAQWNMSFRNRIWRFVVARLSPSLRFDATISARVMPACAGVLWWFGGRRRSVRNNSAIMLSSISAIATSCLKNFAARKIAESNWERLLSVQRDDAKP